MSAGSIDWRRTFASKLKPPVVNPPALRIRYIASVISSGSLWNWSVSQPFCGSPRLMSIEPKMPSASAIDFVVEAVARERRVVGFDVHLHFVLEAVLLEK